MDADLLFTSCEGPRMVVRSCRWCDHRELTPKGIPGVGRGYGLREGNRARGRVIQHVKAEHPREYEYAMALKRAEQAEHKARQEAKAKARAEGQA